jgi:putative transposase
MYAEKRLKSEIAQEALEKVVRPSLRKEMAKKAVEKKDISNCLAYSAFVISQTCYRYSPKFPEEIVLTFWRQYRIVKK